MGGGKGGMIPLDSYDLSDPKNPWIADRKRSTKLAHCYNKIQPIRVEFQKPGNLKFCASFNKINIQRREGLSNFFWVLFFLYYIQKEWIKQEIRSVHVLDIRIK